ncbi:TetR family transcriptional regulator [Mycobacterium florentinum]|uniref:TetR family transcriptional regulator n=1 Tax=Mycobacterium florentinum TaxID=292462 RepID=A0A1X1TWE8_MYCFL|nr:TetR family transcriptional regulator [Mycobacterium florentinum]
MQYGIYVSRDSEAPAKRGPRPRFTREEVLKAALRVIDAEPPEAFTMRRVADELGMGVMTLYGYVRNKEEILEGVTVLLFAEAHRPTSTVNWDQQLRTEVRTLHTIGRRHPNLVTLVLAQRSATPGMFSIRERIVAALLDAGLTEILALHGLGVLCNYALGFAGAQAAAAPIDLPDRIRELPGDTFPRLSALAGNYSAHLSDEAFEFGLDLLVSGLHAQVAKCAAPS